jgi:hypothetical protein
MVGVYLFFGLEQPAVNACTELVLGARDNELCSMGGIVVLFYVLAEVLVVGDVGGWRW